MDEKNDFEVKIPVFEGPFDLLLFFIEKDELDIYNIPIAKITDDFLDYIHHLNTLNIELASEFILVAATLMRIKAKNLLPRPDLNADGEEIDLQKDLIEKLIAYKKYKALIVDFKILEDNRFVKQKRGNILDDVKHLLESSNQNLEELTSFDLYKLLKCYTKVNQNYLIKSTEVKHTIVQYPYNIEEQKSKIVTLIEINKQLVFNDLRSISKDKVQFVYNFLAMLELLQQQILKIQVGLGFNSFLIQQMS
jgi:segregation and condensation protein A